MTDEAGDSEARRAPVEPAAAEPGTVEQETAPTPADEPAAGQATVPDAPAAWPEPAAQDAPDEAAALEPTEVLATSEPRGGPSGPGVEPIAPPPVPLVPAPAVETTRRLLGASFDLLARSSEDMRPASFYIGVLVLGSVGPLAIASWALEIVSIHKTGREMASILDSGGNVWLALLGSLAGIGLLVAAVESRTMAAAILGGRMIGRPLTVRQSLARSRSVFWLVIVGSIIVGIPVLAVQFSLNALFEEALGRETDVSLVSSTLAAALAGAPLAYLLSGIVLGDVDPFEATRRSFRVFRARKLAAVLVAVFETIATLLVLLGLGAGLDIAIRIFGALGLGTGSGPAGLTLMTVGVIAGVFALGTLIFTAYGIVVAPQIVMFVGLTHATWGLDHVRPGGDLDPAIPRAGQRRFRWLTAPLLAGVIVGGLGLLAFLVILSG